MPITAYSKKFKSELDVEQFKNRYNDLIEKPSLAQFVKDDIECSCCGVSGARIIKEGVSSKTNQKVKQTHFAFKDENGGDAHRIFCDHYTGKDKQSSATNDCNINLLNSQSAVTRVIGKFVCTAIQYGFFTQEDIRNMRQWFLEMRSRQDFLVDVGEHPLYILRSILLHENKDNPLKKIELSKRIESKEELNEQAYKSMALNFPSPKNLDEILNLKYYLMKNSIMKKTISLSKRSNGVYEFDRNILQEKYLYATKLSLSIVKGNPLLSSSISKTVHAVRAKNPLMAYSATLLFVNDWDIEKAEKMHDEIYSLRNSEFNLGNVMGLNPFLHYESWIALKYASEWKRNFSNYDFDREFNKEINRLKKI